MKTDILRTIYRASQAVDKHTNELERQIREFATHANQSRNKDFEKTEIVYRVNDNEKITILLSCYKPDLDDEPIIPDVWYIKIVKWDASKALQGGGIFTTVVDRILANMPEGFDSIYIDNVTTPRFRDYLINKGWIVVPYTSKRSFISPVS